MIIFKRLEFQQKYYDLMNLNNLRYFLLIDIDIIIIGSIIINKTNLFEFTYNRLVTLDIANHTRPSGVDSIRTNTDFNLIGI